MKEKKLSLQQIEKLVKKAQKNDEKSFAILYDYFFNRIFRYVSFRIPSTETEDLVGEIFFKIVQNLKKYKLQKNTGFTAWIFKVAHNTIIDFYRKQKELLGIGEENKNDFFMTLPDEKNLRPDEEVLKKEEAKNIKKFLQKLSPLHREILELKFLEEFSNKEIVKITGKSEGNVRIIQLRALRELRKYFPKD
ncbi:sigma-70 family RNA polymerase sigma factor [Candidatus Gracilibacteria bacterium]|nr:sigma-70 family RNA polymerase sigma factor [Candidatus Gracilibacteria bacterium]